MTAEPMCPEAPVMKTRVKETSRSGHSVTMLAYALCGQITFGKESGNLEPQAKALRELYVR